MNNNNNKSNYQGHKHGQKGNFNKPQKVEETEQFASASGSEEKLQNKFVRPEILNEYKLVGVTEQALRNAVKQSLNKYLSKNACTAVILKEVQTRDENKRYKFDVAIDAQNEIFSSLNNTGNSNKGYDNSFQRLLKQSSGSKRIRLTSPLHNLFKSLEYTYPNEEVSELLKYQKTHSGKIIISLDFYQILALLFRTPYHKIAIYEKVVMDAGKRRKGQKERGFLIALLDSAEEFTQECVDDEYELERASEAFDNTFNPSQSVDTDDDDEDDDDFL